MEKYYTYIYYDPTTKLPFYVGKGSNDRAWDHLREIKFKHNTYFYNKVRGMINAGNIPIIGIYGGLDEEFALFLEQELIAKYGRRDLGTGILCNMTNGGDGVTGHSDEVRKRISERTKEAMKRPEVIAKIEQNRPKDMVPWNKGKKATPEHAAKISKALKGKKLSEEEKARRRANKKPVSDKARENLSKGLKGKVKSPEWLAAIKEGRRKAKERRLAQQLEYSNK